MRPTTTGTLRRLARHEVPIRPVAQEWCELCSEPLPGEHRHLLDIDRQEARCVCRACSLLFDHGGAGGGHYRLIRPRRTELADLHLDDLLWAGLGVPVDLAFFVRHREHDSREHDRGEPRVTAHYPNALGNTRAAVPSAAWARLERANPVLREMNSEVEALLVYRRPDPAEHWLLAIDDCYRLAARVRGTWTGMSGGEEVWHQIDCFFTELRGARRTAARPTKTETTWPSEPARRT